MRAAAILCGILLASPFAGALVVPRAPVAWEREWRDGDVLLSAARELGLDVERAPLPVVPPDASVPQMLQRLAERAGTPLSAEDVLAFEGLHPSVAAPVLALLVAVDDAWTMRDHAFQHVSDEELFVLQQALQAGEPRALLVVDGRTYLAHESEGAARIAAWDETVEAGGWTVSLVSHPTVLAEDRAQPAERGEPPWSCGDC